MAGTRRYFGNVRRRDSGRYQARYSAPDGRLLSAPQTFARKSDAVRWLMLKEAAIHRGDWIDPITRASLSATTPISGCKIAYLRSAPWSCIRVCSAITCLQPFVVKAAASIRASKGPAATCHIMDPHGHGSDLAQPALRVGWRDI